MFKPLKTLRAINVTDVKGLSETKLGFGTPKDWAEFNPKTACSTGPAHPQIGYEQREKDTTNAPTKAGQHKLCMTEIQFLNLYWDPKEYPNPNVVYVGAAEGFHFVVLSKLFPMVNFHLYDPVEEKDRDFYAPLNDIPNIHIYRQYFGEEDIVKWSKAEGVFFISDVRNINYISDTKGMPNSVNIDNENSVKADMEMQMEWVKRIKPVKAHLKFRLPYSWNFIKSISDHRVYLDGDLYIQPWTGPNSTECRLVPFDDLRTRKWDYEKHQDQMAYHNRVTRKQTTYFTNILTGEKEPYSTQDGLTNDYDSTLTVYIIKSYIVKLGMEPTTDRVMGLCKYVQLNCKPNTNLYMLRVGIRAKKKAFNVGSTLVQSSNPFLSQNGTFSGPAKSVNFSPVKKAQSPFGSLIPVKESSDKLFNPTQTVPVSNPFVNQANVMPPPSSTTPFKPAPSYQAAPVKATPSFTPTYQAAPGPVPVQATSSFKPTYQAAPGPVPVQVTSSFKPTYQAAPVQATSSFKPTYQAAPVQATSSFKPTYQAAPVQATSSFIPSTGPAFTPTVPAPVKAGPNFTPIYQPVQANKFTPSVTAYQPVQANKFTPSATAYQFKPSS